MKRTLITFFICLFSALSIVAQTGSLPKFTGYAAKKITTKPKALNLNSHPDAKSFRTRLREAHTAGVNFAGSYIVATWGCGTSCYQGAIIDAKTGNVFFPEELSGGSVGFGELSEVENVIDFKPNSRLMIINGYPGTSSDEQPEYGVYYYEWKNNKFNLVKFIPKKAETFDEENTDDQR